MGSKKGEKKKNTIATRQMKGNANDSLLSTFFNYAKKKEEEKKDVNDDVNLTLKRRFFSRN